MFELTLIKKPGPYVVKRAHIDERISDFFRITLTLRTSQADAPIKVGAPRGGQGGAPFSPDVFLGQHVSFEIPDGKTRGRDAARRWVGVCNRAAVVPVLRDGAPARNAPLGATADGRRHVSGFDLADRESGYDIEITVVPEMFLLTQQSSHRIFQHKSVPDIVESILGEWFVEHEWRLDRSQYPKLEYRAQRGETDHAFVTRLLEEAGISHVFLNKHGADLPQKPDEKEIVVVLSDRFEGEPPRAVPLTKLHGTGHSFTDGVTNVRPADESRPAGIRVVGYDFRKPATALAGKAEVTDPQDTSTGNLVHYAPGGFLADSTGGPLPVGDAKGLYRFDPKHGSHLAARTLAAMRGDKRVVDFETNVIDLFPSQVVTIEDDAHPVLAGRLMMTEFAMDLSAEQAWRASGRVVVVDPHEPYRPARKTTKPVAHGIESATVVGPPGAEVHSDELGRVRVQFPWDELGKRDDNSSCWVRVSQGWAGAAFGMIALPRVGQEVLIAYLGGDPDQPIIVGRAYNGLEQVPYKLPDNQTVSGWKTRSTPNSEGFNEIKFEDKAGSELVYLRAERDRHQLVKRDDIELTQRNKKSTVEGDEDILVHGERSVHVGAGANEFVQQDKCESVGQSLSLMVAGNRDEKVGGNHALEVLQTVHVRAGMTLVLEAGIRLTIKGPGGFIDFHPGGIDIVGNIVNINSGGTAGVGAGAKPTPPYFAEAAEPSDTPVP